MTSICDTVAILNLFCLQVPVNYFDYENTTTPRMADTLDCQMEPKVVCDPVTSEKCAQTTYTKCEEVGEDIDISELNTNISLRFP